MQPCDRTVGQKFSEVVHDLGFLTQKSTIYHRFTFFWGVFFVSLRGVLPYFVSAKLFDNKFNLKRKLLLESLLLCFTASMITRPGVAGAVLQTPLLLIDWLRCQVSHVSCNFLCCVFWTKWVGLSEEGLLSTGPNLV